MRSARPPVFADRSDAGRQLAAVVATFTYADPVVIALPRGGVPVGYEVAAALGAPFDVLLVRKLGAPGRPELAIGAIGEGDIEILNHDLITRIGVSRKEIDRIAIKERIELERRLAVYRGGLPARDVDGKTVIVVDDGIATGATARAGCAIAKARGARRVVLAVPVAPNGWTAAEVDDLVAVVQPIDLRSVGSWYSNFEQLDDATVRDILLRPQ